MANPQTTSTAAEVKNVYAVVALPPDDVTPRLKKLMQGLRAEFGGPQFEPHIIVVGPISLTLEDAVTKFRSAPSEDLKAYETKVDHVATGTLFYQSYMPHLSILYGDLTDEEKKAAQEKANTLDESIASLSFPVTRLALHKVNGDHEEKIAECTIESN